MVRQVAQEKRTLVSRMTDWFIIVERRAPGSIERMTGVKKPKRDNQEIFTEKRENSTEISDLDSARRGQETQSSETGEQVSQAVFNTLMMRQVTVKEQQWHLYKTEAQCCAAIFRSWRMTKRPLLDGVRLRGPAIWREKSFLQTTTTIRSVFYFYIQQCLLPSSGPTNVSLWTPTYSVAISKLQPLIRPDREIPENYRCMPSCM